jgi:terminase large subunit-like protein
MNVVAPRVDAHVSHVRDLSWSPQPGPQDDLCCCPFPEVFFGGARGGGKTDGVLGKWALKERRYGAAFNAIMFRRTSVSAEDAIERSKEIYAPLGGRYIENKGWRMPNGGRVTFKYLESPEDAKEYQGRNVTDAWVEEAGQYASPAAIDLLFGVLRSAKGVPVQLILTANPGGAGQHWIRDRYQLHPFPLKPQVLRRKLPNGEEHRIAVIPSRITDNRILINSDPGYVSRLYLVGSAQLVKAWLEGDWTAIEGAFFAEWSNEQHVISPFAIPDHWLRFRSGDWGSYSPFSIGWWAVVGDEFQLPGDGILGTVPEGRSDLQRGDHSGQSSVGRVSRSLPRGAIIRYREWYGTVGGKLTAEQVGKGIATRERDDRAKLTYGVLDPSAFTEDGGPSIAERINDELLAAKLAAFTRADNKRVARQTGDKDKAGPMGGWDIMRQRLVGTAKRLESGAIDWTAGRPMFYCFSTCKDFVRTFPVLQHDQNRAEDLDTDAEDHAADDGRYACLSRPWIKSLPKDDVEKRDAYRESNDDRYSESTVTL